MKVYLDNDLASAISRRDIVESELYALDLIVQRPELFQILTSRQTTREMEQAPSQYQESLKQGISKLDLVDNDHKVLGHAVQQDQLGGFVGYPIVTDIVNDELYKQLLGVGIREADARHLMYATQNGCGYFLTLDRGILSRAESVGSMVDSNFLVQKPSQLVAGCSGITAD